MKKGILMIQSLAIFLSLIAIALGTTPQVVKAETPVIPAGVTIDSAVLQIYTTASQGYPINIYYLTSAWGETEVTWNSFNSVPTSYEPAIVNSFAPIVGAYVSVDIKSLFTAWMQGTSNFGILLKNEPWNQYYAREGAYPPKLHVCYTFNGQQTCLDIADTKDTYIWENYPDNNYGTNEYMASAAMGEYQKWALLAFDFTVQQQPATIGDFVWNDANHNGIQDAGEPGIQNNTVALYTCAGDLVSTMYTDANGKYLFSGLTPEDYYVKFTLPAGYAFSPQDAGTNDAIDSDANVSTGQTACTTLTSGETDLTWDAGMYLVYTNPGTGTPGYWKNHPDAWPVQSIVIGGVTYTKAQAIYWISQNDKQDKTITMFRALVAAKLNIANGNDPTCIADTVAAADAWMAAHPVGSSVPASGDAWQAAESLYNLLDQYNNGYLCVAHRD